MNMYFLPITTQIIVQDTQLKAEFHGQAHARADRLKNKLYRSTLNSMRACGGTIC